MRKILVAFLSLLILVTSFSITAFADTETVSTEAELKAVVTELNNNGGEATVTLGQNIVLQNSLGISKGTLTILGEGNKITGQIYTTNTAVLNLGSEAYDKTLQIDSTDSTLCVLSTSGSSTLSIYDHVTIGPSTAAGQAGGIQARGTSNINMYGGKISDCHGLYALSGGVYIEENAVFTMYDGLIENCTGVIGGAVGIAGGIPIGSLDTGLVFAKFHMKGGTIQNCHDNYLGGGAVNAYTRMPATFIMDGGKITGCTSGTGAGYGGAIFMYSTDSRCSFELNAGEISGNTGKYGGGIFAYSGNLKIADNFKLYNNTATSAGDDIFNNGTNVTLGTANTTVELPCGHLVDGWYDDGDTRWSYTGCNNATESHTEKFTQTGTLVTTAYGLKAAHSEVSHTVEFKFLNPQTSEIEETGITEQIIVDGQLVTVPVAPTVNGYTFEGWYLGDTLYDFTTPVTEDLTLVAKYSKIPVKPNYILHYDSNGGTQYEDERYKSGTVVSLDKKPTKNGYTFNGWYSDKELSNKITTIKMNGNKTVYAGWTYNYLPADLNSKDHIAYVQGYPDGLVKPNNNITRAETSAMLYRLLTEDRRAEIETDKNSFTDVKATNWFNVEVSTMANGDYITGYPDGTFGGNKNITRAEFAAILVRFIGIQDTTCNFNDVDQNHWAYDYIATAVTAGWITGYEDNTYKPNQPITRAEAMTIINRVLNRGVNENSELLDFKVWPDNQIGDWYYYEVIEATNHHDYTGERPAEDWTAIFN